MNVTAKFISFQSSLDMCRFNVQSFDFIIMTETTEIKETFKIIHSVNMGALNITSVSFGQSMQMTL